MMNRRASRWTGATRRTVRARVRARGWNIFGRAFASHARDGLRGGLRDASRGVRRGVRGDATCSRGGGGGDGVVATATSLVGLDARRLRVREATSCALDRLARDALEARVAGRARGRLGVRRAGFAERAPASVGALRVARRVGAWGVSTPPRRGEVTPRGGVFRRGDGPRRGRSGRGRGGEGLRAGRLARHAREESLRLGAKARLLPEDARRFRGREVLDGDVVVAVECHDEAAIALAGEHPRRHAVRVARAHVAPSEETRRAAPVLVRAPGG